MRLLMRRFSEVVYSDRILTNLFLKGRITEFHLRFNLSIRLYFCLWHYNHVYFYATINQHRRHLCILTFSVNFSFIVFMLSLLPEFLYYHLIFRCEIGVSSMLTIQSVFSVTSLWTLELFLGDCLEVFFCNRLVYYTRLPSVLPRVHLLT